MAIEYNSFIHPSDKAAMDALKAIPGFDLLVKKYMSIVGEKMFKLQFTSSCLKLGPDQMPEIYNVLVKVCKKLDIEVPELYLSLDREVNASTCGDTDIFIVINSGLIETLTPEQIETVIAHECGHILCHHNLYTTMGRLILSGADYFANGIISRTLYTTLTYAFAYWMRCSEFSADRVSAYCQGSPDSVVNVMMALSGGTSNLNYTFSTEAFLAQAESYKELVDNSKYNKILEFIQFGLNSHPLNAYRAYEIKRFYSSDPSGDSDGEPIRLMFKVDVKYEYIKPTNKLMMGGILDIEKLRVSIDGEPAQAIAKNSSFTFELGLGEHTLIAEKGDKKVEYTFVVAGDMAITVSWDSDSEALTIG